jgi:peptide/nickel transport system substrate-binding protein
MGYIPSGGIKPDLLPQFDSVTDTFDVIDTEQKSFFYLQFECGEGSVFADERMREAFWSSINFDDIAQYVLGGGTTMTQFIPDGFEGYDESLPAYEYNPERAAELLQECGYDGSEIDIYSSITTYMSEDQLLAIADYANSVGFNCRIFIVVVIIKNSFKCGYYIVCIHFFAI